MREHVDFDQFPQELERQSAQSPLDGQSIYQAWVQQRTNGVRVRERLLCYFELLLQSGVVTDAEVLTCILREFKSGVDFESHGPNYQMTQSTVAAVLDRLSFQMIQRRNIVATDSERISVFRIAKPLIVLVSTFTKALEHLTPLAGPYLEIGNALGQYVGAYINDLSKVGLLTSRDGRPSKGIFKKLLLEAWKEIS